MPRPSHSRFYHPHAIGRCYFFRNEASIYGRSALAFSSKRFCFCLNYAFRAFVMFSIKKRVPRDRQCEFCPYPASVPSAVGTPVRVRCSATLGSCCTGNRNWIRSMIEESAVPEFCRKWLNISGQFCRTHINCLAHRAFCY